MTNWMKLQGGLALVRMGQSRRTVGETNIRLTVRPGTSDIITAYPWK